MEIDIHNAPTCTCARIKWLAANCQRFELVVASEGCNYAIDALMTHDVYYQSAGPVEELSEAVAECFFDMWAAWTPKDGIKID